MKISTRLTLSTVTVLFLTVLVGVVGISGINRVAAGLAEVSGNWLPSVRYSAAIRADILDYRNRETQLLIAEGAAEIDETVGRMSKNRQELEKHDAAFKPLIRSPEQQTLYDAYRSKLSQFFQVHDQLETMVRAGKSAEAIAFFRSKSRSVFRDLLPAIDKLVEYSVSGSDKAQVEGDVATRSSQRWMSVMIGFALLLGIGATLWVTRTIRSALHCIHDRVVAIESTSDFTQRINLNSTDELGETAGLVDKLIGKVQQAFRDIRGGIGQVTHAAGDLAASANQVASASNQQADSAATMAAAVEEMSASIDQVTDSAQQAHRLSGEAETAAKAGGGVIGSVISRMNEVASQSQATSDSIVQLGASFKEITSIVHVISEVAEQTNLLALNATIEAARAGEQGRGFAVVADEVRKLAERTANSSASINNKIESMQHRVEQAIAKMQEVESLAAEGARSAGDADRSVRAIMSSSGQVESQVTAISDALREQDQASRQIAEHVERIAHISEGNSQDAAATAELSQQLAKLAKSMQDAVSAFKV